MLTLSIIGLNAISGSLGLKLIQVVQEKAQEIEEFRIVGYDQDPRVVREARRLGAIHQEARSLKDAVRDADIVVIATEAGQTGWVLQEIAPHLKQGAIVTDTTSSKTPVLQWAREALPAGVSFVGGHPILSPLVEQDGEGGIAGASADLLKDAIYCLIPAGNASDEAVDTVQGMAQLAGASAFFLGAEEHDGLLAGLAHMPYLLAAAMLQAIGDSPSWRDLKLLADPAFVGLNRLLTTRPPDYYQTCLVNRLPLISWLDRIIAALSAARNELADESSEGEALQSMVERAEAARQDWMRRRDEREKEREPVGEIETFGDRLLGLFVPRSFRRRPPPREE